MNKKIYYIITFTLFPIFCLSSTLINIKSSSTLYSSDKRYSALNLIDEFKCSSWSEGKKGDGIGEYVEYVFKNKIKFNHLNIINGFGIRKFWKMNNRVKDLLILTDSKKQVKITLKDTFEPQRIFLGKYLNGKRIKFIIKSIYKGSKWSDTCISEIIIPKMKIGIISCISKYLLFGKWSYVPPPGGGVRVFVFRRNGLFLCKSFIPGNKPCLLEKVKGFYLIQANKIVLIFFNGKSEILYNIKLITRNRIKFKFRSPFQNTPKFFEDTLERFGYF